MPLKTTSTLPPGGWVYEQKDGEKKVIGRFRSMSPFWEAVTEILRFRENNKLPRASRDEVAEDLEQAQCERLGFDPNWCVVKKNSPAPFNPTKLFQASAQHLRRGVQHASRIGQAADGLAIVKDWLGDGAVPVPAEQSQARADVCTGRLTGKPCPFNKPGFRPVEEAAEIIRRQVEKKHEMKLEVIGEALLHTCDLCWCHLPLKVHVPLSTILNRTPQPMVAKFKEQQPACWINIEQTIPA